MVPLSPFMARGAFSSEAMTARRPGPDWAKEMAAYTLGSMEPGAKWPSSQ